MKTPLFLVALVLICSYASSTTIKPAINITQVPFNGEKFHFLLTVQEEIPQGRNVFRDGNGLDFLELRESIGLSENVEKFIKQRVRELKTLLYKTNLWSDNFQDATSTSFATHDLQGTVSLDFFLQFAKNLFNDEGLRKHHIIPKTLTEDNKQEFFAQTHDNLDLIELINFSYGYYRKATGLNLIPEVCPALDAYMHEQWKNINEFKAFFVLKEHDKLVDYLSDHFEKKHFNGTDHLGNKWVFDGKKRPLGSSPQDLSNFLETFNYDTQYEIEEIAANKHAEVKQLREDFITHYLAKVSEFAGHRFFSFVHELLNLRDEYSNGFNHKALPMKKWYMLGSSDIGVNYLTRFLEDKLKIKFSSVQVGESLNFFFTGDKKSIQNVHFYYNTEFVKTISLKDLLHFSIYEYHDHVAFNRLCINKDYVDHIEKDY
jgi:hypothetical protein